MSLFMYQVKEKHPYIIHITYRIKLKRNNTLPYILYMSMMQGPFCPWERREEILEFYGQVVNPKGNVHMCDSATLTQQMNRSELS